MLDKRAMKQVFLQLYSRISVMMRPFFKEPSPMRIGIKIDATVKPIGR
jgi:hypothetical protein